MLRSEYNSTTVKKRFIKDKKELMREMCACKDCDCETYPYCTTLGMLCRECFDVEKYEHKIPIKNDPGKYQITVSSKKEPPVITHPYIKIIPTPLDGDCLYKAVSLAFDEKITVEALRFLVATNQTEVTYGTYKELSTYMSEYEPIKASHNIQDFRILLKKTGEQIGCTNCVWGDENALQIIATQYNIIFVIFNEKGQHIQKITPANLTNSFNGRYVLLLLNSSKQGNEHYNLLQFNNRKLITQYEWDKLKEKITKDRV